MLEHILLRCKGLGAFNTPASIHILTVLNSTVAGGRMAPELS